MCKFTEKVHYMKCRKFWKLSQMREVSWGCQTHIVYQMVVGLPSQMRNVCNGMYNTHLEHILHSSHPLSSV